MKITRAEDNLIITLLLKGRRYNPYNEMAGLDPYTGDYDAVVGVIENHDGYSECGFMGVQDFSYKNKGDQLTDWIIKTNLEPEEFEKLVKELKMPLWRI